MVSCDVILSFLIWRIESFWLKRLGIDGICRLELIGIGRNTFDCEFAGCKAARRSWGFSSQWPWGFTPAFGSRDWRGPQSQAWMVGESLWLGANLLHMDWNTETSLFSDHFFAWNLAMRLCLGHKAGFGDEAGSPGWCLCRCMVPCSDRWKNRMTMTRMLKRPAEIWDLMIPWLLLLYAQLII